MLSRFGTANATVSGPLLAQASPLTRLGDVVLRTDLAIPLDAMEAEVLVRPYVTQSAFDLEQWRQLSGHLYQLGTADGAVDWHRAVGLHRQRLIWSDFVAKHRSSTPSSPSTDASRPWQETLSEKPDLIGILLADIHSAGIDVDQLMILIGRDQRLNQELQPLRKSSTHRFHVGDLALILKGELSFVEPFPFVILKWLADRLQRDVRRYVVHSNRYLYEKIAPAIWSHPLYPIYLETELDLKVAAKVKGGQQGHGIGSFGWQLWAIMKYPTDYRNVAQLAADVKLGQGTIRGLLQDNKKPSGETVYKITDALPPQYEEVLLRAFNDSYFFKLNEQLQNAALYPGQTIFIGRRPEDETKLRRFLNRPAHPARFLLGARNLFLDIPEIVVLSRELSLSSGLLRKMEAGKVPVHSEYLPAWLRLYERFGTPLELMKIGAAIEFGIGEESSVWRTTKPMRRRSRPGKLPDSIVSGAKRKAAKKARRTKRANKQTSLTGPVRKTLLSTNEHPVIEERSPLPDGGLRLVYRRAYEGRWNPASIRDGVLQDEINIIDHVRDRSGPATLEIELNWPQKLYDFSLKRLRHQAEQVAAATPGIQEIVLIWRSIEGDEDSEKPAAVPTRLVLFPGA